MRAEGLGHVLFASGLAGLGVLSLLSGDFALNWQPVPTWVAWREPLAYASGLVMFAGGVGMLLKRTAALSALVLTIYSLLWLVLLRTPRVVAAPLSAGMWLGFAENLVLVAGAWVLLVSVVTPEDGKNLTRVTSHEIVPIAQFLFAISLPLLGLSHLVYVQATTELVPAWLPDRTGFTYLTGVAHIAAGVAILVAILPRLAATLEAVMLTSFTLLVWVPRVAAAPANRFPWTALLVSWAITGAAWAVATSLREVPWGARRTLSNANAA